MGIKQVDRFEAFAADLGVKVDAAGAEAAVLEDRQHALRGEVVVGRELVGVPAEEQVARVGVDRAEATLCACVVELVHHRVTGEGRVIGLEVELEVGHQVVLPQEVDAGGGVGIVLMLGRLFRLGLNEEGAFEADFLGVVDRHVEELGEVIELALHVGVIEALVAFAAAPEDVVFAAEIERDFEAFFDLGRGEGEDVSIAAGRGAVHEAGVAEEIAGAPEELHAGLLLFFFENLGDGIEVFVRLAECFAFGGDVAIVERVKGRGELGSDLKGNAGAVAGVFDGIAAVIPGAKGGAGAEGITTGAAHSVPIDDAEPEVVLHRFAFNHFAFVVPAEGERVFGLGAFVGDLLDVRKGGHGSSLCFEMGCGGAGWYRAKWGFSRQRGEEGRKMRLRVGAASARWGFAGAGVVF